MSVHFVSQGRISAARRLLHLQSSPVLEDIILDLLGMPAHQVGDGDGNFDRTMYWLTIHGIQTGVSEMESTINNILISAKGYWEEGYQDPLALPTTGKKEGSQW